MELTLKWLQANDACQSGIDWYLKQGTTDFINLLKLARDAGRVDDFLWGYARRVNRKTRILWACHAVELALPIFEAKYPADDRPRKAIEAAKKCALRNTAKNISASAAAYAVSSVASAAAYAAAADAYAAATNVSYAAYKDANVANAVASAASAAANVAASVAYSAYASAASVAYSASAAAAAAYAVDATAYAATARAIMDYGIQLLEVGHGSGA